nr:Chain B, Peptide EEYSAM [Homo sapiens]
EEYSAM